MYETLVWTSPEFMMIVTDHFSWRYPEKKKKKKYIYLLIYYTIDTFFPDFV